MQIDGYPDADVRVTKTSYQAAHGGVSGWTLKKATSRTVDAVTGGENLTSHTVHDAAGRVIKLLEVGSTGSDAKTRETIYYTAGANGSDSACGNRPEWAGQPCLTRAAGAVTGHDPARMATHLPVRRVTAYNRYANEAVVTETAAGKTRTTTTAYDTAGRTTSNAIVSDEGAAVGTITTTYHPENGQVATTMGTGTISQQYDNLGRLVSYTDADGATTVTEFDRFGNQVKVSDPAGHKTYAYDRTAEPRGLLTNVTDSVAGAFAAKYSPDGHLTEMTYPGGLTRTDRLDANLQPVERTYTRDSDGEVIYSESVVENTTSQWVNHTYTGGSKQHRYDRLGRLTRTQHDTALTEGCVTRTYRYDDRYNRRDVWAYSPGEGGECQQDTGAEYEQAGYDTADRLTNAGYVYDAFGRTSEIPGGLSNSYFANDLVQRQQLGDSRQTWFLDPALRFRSSTTETLVDEEWGDAIAKVNHYGDDSDEVAWVGDGSTGSVARNVCGPDGDLAATTFAAGDVVLQLTNLHGDVAVAIDVTMTEPELFDYDEFGMPMAAQSNQRYGWLGGKQRSSEALGDSILMGVRLYSPALGRFLQIDPIYGGSCNAYEYTCADPVNATDLDGKRRCSRWARWACRTYNKAQRAGRATRNAARFSSRNYRANRSCWSGTSGSNCGRNSYHARVGRSMNRSVKRACRVYTSGPSLGWAGGAMGYGAAAAKWGWRGARLAGRAGWAGWAIEGVCFLHR
ncbi:RHS repeat-associated core domain-containing protein [Micromonospora sp. WMMA1923]|uniref:RHS repeat-associated core domain-containing protein n=1 Tax=Micromonospora sp. WMMA1923 TaxID=3404125 RepID=UPI003B935DE6